MALKSGQMENEKLKVERRLELVSEDLEVISYQHEQEAL
jgi:hypothetical protein